MLSGTPLSDLFWGLVGLSLSLVVLLCLFVLALLGSFWLFLVLITLDISPTVVRARALLLFGIHSKKSCPEPVAG